MAGVPGSQPADLLNPTANGQQQANNIGQLASFKMPPAPQGAPQTGGGDQNLDSILDQHLAPPSAPKQGDELDSILDQHLSNTEPAPFMQRVKAGFAANDKEKEGYLKQQYGDSNVRKNKDDAFEIKEKGKWHPFNADYHMPDIMGGMQQPGPSIGDPANLGRQAMVEAGAAPAEIAGGMASAGEASTGVGAAAVGSTMAAARIAGGATGEALARHTAYNIIGIPKSGDYATDAAAMVEQGGLRGIFGKVADKVSSYLAGHLGEDATGAVAKNIADDTKDAVDGLGKGLGQAAIQTSQQAVKNQTSADAVSAARIHLDDVLKLSQQAKAANIDLYPHELAPFDPKAQKLAESAMSNKSIQNSMVVRGDGIKQAAQDFLNLFPDASSSNIEDLMSKGLDKGKSIGQSLGQARQKLADTTENVATQKLGPALEKLRQTFSFDGKKPPTDAEVEELANKLQRPIGDLRYVIGRVSKLTDMYENGKGMMSPKDLNSFYGEFTKAIDSRVPAPGTRSETFSGLVKLKDAIRDDVTGALGTELKNQNGKLYQSLDPAEREMYQNNMAEYSKYATAKQNLSKLFDKDALGDVDIVKWLRAGGIGNADRVNDFKTIMNLAGPDAWQRVGQEYVKNILSDNAMPGAEAQVFGNVNWKTMQKQLMDGTKQGEYFKNVLGEDVAKKIGDATDAFAAIQNGNKPFTAQPNLVYRAVKALCNLKDPAYAASILKSDYYARQMLDDAATQKLIKRLSQPEQDMLNQAASQAMQDVMKRSIKPQSGIPAQIATQSLQNQQQQ